MRYKVFFIAYNPYVVFTKNDRQYVRRLYSDKGGLFIRFKNQRIKIADKFFELYEGVWFRRQV